MNWFIERMKEPSTHAAVTGAIAALIPLVPPQYQWIAQLIAGGFATYGVAAKEKS